jgi:hypothetical protein
MIGFLVPLIFVSSIWYMIEANLLLAAIRHSTEEKKSEANFFSHSGRWYLIKMIVGAEKLPSSLTDEDRDRLARVRVSLAISLLSWASFVYFVKR